jgi:4-diphosphocytidyl-2-C-methyl-D-erythritol kinase
MDMSVREPAHAKINLTLQVRGRRADGYHALASLVTFAGVHDVVTLRQGSADCVTVTGEFAQSIVGENLLSRALAVVRETEPDLPPFAVELDKNLPVAAGVGGGSADAAALLRAVRSASGELGSSVPWRAIAARLGSDVPVCLDSAPALMWGRGEHTAPVTHMPTVYAVLVNPGVPLETARVFAALNAGPAAYEGAPQSPPLRSVNDLVAYIRATGNDLERPTVQLLPVVAEVKSALRAQPGCLVDAMSGSGPTCFGMFAGAGEAQRAASAIQRAQRLWWVRSTILAGAPPAGDWGLNSPG